MERFQQADLECFRAAVGGRLGLQFDDSKNELLADVLRQRLQARRQTGAATYLASIAGESDGREELRTLASLLTVTETYFFRDANQFRALEAALAQRISVHPSDRRLRLLSAGCASGEEPYSLAMVLRERFPELEDWRIEILGFDLNPAMIAKARKARYTQWSLRETSDDWRQRYFRKDGSEFVLDESIRAMVRFEEQNLAGTSKWSRPDQFDIILCRNVLMYLVPSALEAVIQKLTGALVPDGFLFLGSAETLRGLSQDFHLRHTHEAFYYQKREAAGQPAARLQETQDRGAGPPLDLADIAWVDAIQRASERIDNLSRDCRGQAEPPPRAAARPHVDLGFVFELLRQERFREALDILHRLPDLGLDPDVQLLRAGLLANCGDLDTAESVCRHILAADDLNAGAHYLTALCREHAGDTAAAMEHDRAAIYLDGAFAMPHLHLGRLAKRSADLGTARRELESAGTLLSREIPERILLFGGGFSRDALLAFSRAELQACGGSK